MELAYGFPPLPGDPGGPVGKSGSPSNRVNGEYTGPRYPDFMDRDGTAGPLQFLKMQAVSGAIPQDPFLLRLSVEKYLGGPIEGAYKENRGIAYVLKVRSQAQFNRLLKMKTLNDGTAIEIKEHDQLNQRKCVVSNIDSVGLTDDYLKSQLASQGVKEIRRIKRKIPNGAWENTPTIILTIAGTVIPPHIDFGWSRCRTRNYYPSPMLCFHCWEYGHTGKRCPQQFRTCGRCSKTHPEDRPTNSSTLPGENPPMATQNERPACTEDPFCKHCKSGDHPVSSRRCATYLREVDIQHIRVDEGISYPQARKIYEARLAAGSSSTAYSGVVNASKDAENTELRSIIKQLQEDAKLKDRRMEEMERKLKSNTINDRMETSKKHGTIDDLVRQVAELSAMVSRLEKALMKKDEIIEAQAKELAKLRAVDSDSNPSAFSIPESEISDETVSRENSHLNPKNAKQIDEWFTSMGNNEAPLKVRKIPATTKPSTTNESGHETDTSMKSADSNQSLCSKLTDNSNPSKRTHENRNSSGESSTGSPKSKRTSNVRKGKGGAVKKKK